MRKAKTDQCRLDLAALSDAAEGIRQGLQDVKEGKLRPAEEFFAEFEARHCMPH
jgi:hypothetical protein